MASWIKIIKSELFVTGRLLPYCIAMSVVIGIICTIFLVTLDWVTLFFNQHRHLIYALPLVGVLIVFLYDRFGKGFISGNDTIYKAIEDPILPILPTAKTVLIYITTLLTHIVGGSAGREGTAIQMSAPLADWMYEKFRLEPFQRKALLIAAVAGGLGAVFATPLAGAIFSFEVWKCKLPRIHQVLLALMTAYASSGVGSALSAPHTVYLVKRYQIESLNGWVMLLLLAMALLIWSLLYKKLYAVMIYYGKLIFVNRYYRIILGGLILMIFMVMEGSYKYCGLGVPEIQKAMISPASASDFILKTLLTIGTLSVGYRGGEATPLFFIGATLASFLSTYLGLPQDFLAAIGFVTFFGLYTNTPLASAFMGMELFGYAMLPYTLLVGMLCMWMGKVMYRNEIL
jgi:H+/Cl- antiporter ClcA